MQVSHACSPKRFAKAGITRIARINAGESSLNIIETFRSAYLLGGGLHLSAEASPFREIVVRFS
jgi:hypothetical protein